MTIAELSPVSPPDQGLLDPAGPAGTDAGTALGEAGAGGAPAGDVAAGLPSDRLRLRPANPAEAAGRGFVDGGWWPQSDDLAAELPRLLAEMSSRGYGIRRVTYNLDAWAPAPRRLTVRGQVVKLGGFRTQSPAELVLVDSGGWQRTELVVVPPHSDPALAERVLVLAATLGDQHRAAEILELAAR